MNKQLLYKLLYIKPGEIDRVAYLFLVQLCSGIGLVFMFIVATTLFLNSVEMENLPWVFVISGASLILINFIYEEANNHFSIRKICFTILIACGLVLAFFPFFIGSGHGEKGLYVLFALYFVFYYLVSTGFWGIAALVFDVRESKRLFSIISAGDILSKLIGYGAVYIVVKYVGGYEKMLLISTVFFVLAAFFLHLFFEKTGTELKHEFEDNEEVEKIGVFHTFINNIFGNRLILWISVISLLLTCSLTLLDFEFLSKLKFAKKSEEDLMRFLATFFAISRIIAVVFKLVLSSRLQHKLGISKTLLTLPATIFFAIAFYFITNGFSGSDQGLYILGFLVVLTEVIRASIYDPLFFALFQPLKPSLRLKGHSIVKGIVNPAGQLLMGLLLLFIFKTTGFVDSDVVFQWLFVLTIMWMGAVLITTSSYYRSIKNALKNNSIFNISRASFLNHPKFFESIDLKLNTGQVEDKLIALEMIYGHNKNKFFKLVPAYLENEDPKMVDFLLVKISENKWEQFIPEIKSLYHRTVTDMRYKMARFMSEMDFDLYQEIKAEARETKDHRLAIAGITGALQSKDINSIIDAGQEILNRSASGTAKDVSEVLDIVEQTGNPILYKQLIPLLTINGIPLQRKLILTIGKINHPYFLDYLLEKGMEPRLAPDVDKVLVQMVDHWITNLVWVTEKLGKERVVNLLIRANTPDTNSLLEELFYTDDEMRPEIVIHLFLNKQTRGEPSRILPFMANALDELVLLKQQMNHGGTTHLYQALQEERLSRVGYLLALLGLIDTDPRIKDIYYVARRGITEKYGHMLEILEVKGKKFNLPKLDQIIEDVFYQESYLRSDIKSVIEVCKEILRSAALKYNDWTIAVSLYILKQSGKAIANHNYEKPIHRELTQ